MAVSTNDTVTPFSYSLGNNWSLVFWIILAVISSIRRFGHYPSTLIKIDAKQFLQVCTRSLSPLLTKKDQAVI